MSIYTEGDGHSERERGGRGRRNEDISSDNAAAALVAGNDASSSSFARFLLSSVLARALGVVAEVVRHLHRVHQRGAAAVLFLLFRESGKRERVRGENGG